MFNPYPNDPTVEMILKHGGSIGKGVRVFFACRFVASCGKGCTGAAEYFVRSGTFRCLEGSGFNGTREEILERMGALPEIPEHLRYQKRGG